MRLVADEGVDKPIVEALRREGFDVLYILETYRGAEDDTILSLSNDLQRVLLTQDKDFGELVYRLKQAHFGVVLIRLEGYSPQLKAEITLNVFTEYMSELVNAFTVIQPNAIRIRK